MGEKKIVLGCVYCGRGWKGYEAGIIAEKEWREMNPSDFPPNVRWEKMSIEEALNSEYCRYILNRLVKDFAFDVREKSDAHRRRR